MSDESIAERIERLVREEPSARAKLIRRGDTAIRQTGMFLLC
jgi:hypothetical protein